MIIDYVLQSLEGHLEQTMEQQVLDFKKGDDEKLWEIWHDTQFNRGKIFVLPFGYKVIDGFFFYLLENYGTEILYDALEYLSKQNRNSSGTDYCKIHNEAIPIILFRQFRKSKSNFQIEVTQKALELMAKDKTLTMHIAKMKVIREMYASRI